MKYNTSTVFAFHTELLHELGEVVDVDFFFLFLGEFRFDCPAFY